MKHLKLILAAFAATLSAQVSAYEAPTAPTAPSYEGTWVAPEAGGQYFIYNEGSKTFLGAGLDWGTRVVTTVDKISLPNASFNFSTNNNVILAFEIENATGGVYIKHLRSNSGTANYISHEGNASWIDCATDRRGLWSLKDTENGYLITPNDAAENVSFGVDGNNLSSSTVAYTWTDLNYGSNDKAWVYWRFVSVNDAESIQDFITTGLETYNTNVSIYNAKLPLYNTLVEADSYYAHSNDNTEGTAKSALKQAIDDAVSVYENSEVVADINAAQKNLKAAMNTFVMSGAVPTDGIGFNLTDNVLTNADFSAGNISGWETNYVSGVQASNIGYQSASYTNGNVVISKFIEAWKSGNQKIGDGYLRQTVKNLPEGKYTLEADAIAVNQSGNPAVTTGAYLYIEADGVTYKTSLSTGNAAPEHFSTEFLSPGDVDVTFGLMTENATCNWIAADNFVVKWYGIDLTPYAQTLADAVTEAEEVMSSEIPEGFKTAIQTAIDEYDKTWTTSKQYSAAIAAIQAATNTGKAAKTAYAKYLTNVETVKGIAEQDVYTDKNNALATFNSKMSEIDNNVQAATTVETIDNQIPSLYTAVKTFIGSVEITSGKAFDLTSLIINPNVTSKEGWEGDTPGAYVEGTAEFFNVDFDFYQTISGMPKGNYELKVQAFQRPGSNDVAYNDYVVKGQDKVNAYIYINEGSTKILNVMSQYSETGYFTEGEGWGPQDYLKDGRYTPNGMHGAALYFAAGYYENSVLTSVDGALKLGFRCKDHAADAWTIFGNFRLFYYGDKVSIAMNETEGFTALADMENADVTLTKSVYNGWNTVVLPFDVDATTMKAQLGEGKLYAYTGDADGVLNFEEKTAIEANVPYLFNADDADAESKVMTFNGVTIKYTESATTEGTNYSFVGALTPTIAGKHDYVLNEDGFIRVKGGNTIKAFRAYIQKPENAGSKEEPAESKLNIVINGETTSIDAIDGKAISNDAIYNLNGVRMSGKLQKGIYIQNGKKIVVK